MLFYELLDKLDGKENLEIHIEGLKYHNTTRNVKAELFDKEVDKVRLDSTIYLGMKVYLK